jgi:hypothetical protein
MELRVRRRVLCDFEERLEYIYSTLVSIISMDVESWTYCERSPRKTRHRQTS